MALSTELFDGILPMNESTELRCICCNDILDSPGYREIVLLSIHRAQITIALIALIKCGLQIYVDQHVCIKTRSNNGGDYRVCTKEIKIDRKLVK